MLLGYPQAALADTNQALNDARQIDHAGTLAFALFVTTNTYFSCGDYVTAKALADQLFALADEKEMILLKTFGRLGQGCAAALTGKWADVTEMITFGLKGWRSAGATLLAPMWLSLLASARAELGQVDDAWHCLEEALTEIETRKERWCESEVNRVAGAIALKSLEPEVAKAESYFEHALSVARQQQAKSWELRAAMSMARLWRDQGKRDEARNLLAPVYNWFTEGFDTLDLKEAKALLEQLS